MKAVPYTCTNYTLFKNEEKINASLEGNRKIEGSTERFQKYLRFNHRVVRSTQFRSRVTMCLLPRPERETEEAVGRKPTTPMPRQRGRRTRRRGRGFVDYRKYWVPKRKNFKYKKHFLAPLIPSEDWDVSKTYRGAKRAQAWDNLIYFLKFKKRRSNKRSVSMQTGFWTLRPTHLRLFAKSYEEFGRITPVRMNFLNSKHQRYAASLVKRARLSGLLPFIFYRRTLAHRFISFRKKLRGKRRGWKFHLEKKCGRFRRLQQKKRKNDLDNVSLRLRKSLRESMRMIFLSLNYSVEQINNFFNLVKVKGGLTKRAYYLFFKNMRQNIKNLERLHPRSFGSLRAKLGSLIEIFEKKPCLGYVRECFAKKVGQYCRSGIVLTKGFDFWNMGLKVLSYQVVRSILLVRRACWQRVMQRMSMNVTTSHLRR